MPAVELWPDIESTFLHTFRPFLRLLHCYFFSKNLRKGENIEAMHRNRESNVPMHIKPRSYSKSA